MTKQQLGTSAIRSAHGGILLLWEGVGLCGKGGQAVACSGKVFSSTQDLW